MPDITMCTNELCPLRSKCFRHEASGTVPTPGRQSRAKYWFTVEQGDGVQCDGFWPQAGLQDY